MYAIEETVTESYEGNVSTCVRPFIVAGPYTYPGPVTVAL